MKRQKTWKLKMPVGENRNRPLQRNIDANLEKSFKKLDFTIKLHFYLVTSCLMVNKIEMEELVILPINSNTKM